MKRWLRISAIVLGTLVLLVALLAWVVLGTRGGARFVLDRVVPQLQVGALDGRLWGPLVLEDVRYETPGMELRVARVRVDWHPTRLLRKVVAITVLEVDTARARLRPTESASGQGGGPSPLSVPLEIRVGDLEAREAQLVTVGGDTVRLGLLAAAGLARADTFAMDSLRLRRFRVRGHEIRVDAGGRLVTGATGARDTADVQVSWSGELAGGRPVAGQGSITGGAGTLRIAHRLRDPVPATLDATILSPWLPDSLGWRASLQVPRLALAELRPGTAGEAGLQAEARGDLGSAEGTLRFQAATPALGPLEGEARLAYRDRTLTMDTIRIGSGGSPTELRGRGHLDLGRGLRGDVRLAWSDLGWPLDTARVSSPGGTLEATGAIDDFRVTGGLALRQPDRDLGRWTFQGRGSYADGRLVVPGLDLRADAGQRLSLTADLAFRDGPSGRAELQWTDLTWPLTGDTALVASGRGRLEARGAPDDFTIVASAALGGRSIPAGSLELEARGSAGPDTLRARLQGSGSVEGVGPVEIMGRGALYRGPGRLAVDTLDVRLPETGGRLALRGETNLADPLGRLTGRARWRGLGWPVDSARFASPSGEIVAQPRDGGVRVRAEAQVAGTDLPDGSWRLTGVGDPGRFVVDTLEGRLLDGRVLGAGEVASDSGTWRLRLTADSLDPGQWREGWDGRLGFQLEADGGLGAPGFSYRVRLDSLAGVLRARELVGGAVARGGSGRIAVDTLWVRAGESEVAAAGTVADSLDLGWRVDAESLFDLVPFASGAVAARGTVTGSRQAPTVSLTADGHGLSWGAWSTGGLAAEADLVAGGGEPSSARVELANVQGPSLSLDSVTARLQGTREDHTATFLARSAGDTINARVAGGLIDDAWRGSLDRLGLQSEGAGGWRLRSAVQVAVSADSGRVERGCWEGSGELCASASWDAAGVRWEATGQGLPMAFLDPAIPQGITARGTFALETRGRTGGAVPMGMVRLSSGPGEVHYVRGIARTVTQPYDSLTVDVTSDSAGVRADGALALGDLGSVTASATLSGAGPVPDRSLSGRLRLRLQDRDGATGRYFAGITETRGTAEADIDLAGTVGSPRAEGTIRLSDVAAALEPAGIRLEDGRLDARSAAGGEWTLEGGVRSDTSRLAITGTARPPADSAWRVDLRLEADGFRAVDTEELLVVASPRLDVRTTRDSVIVTGRVTVPRARIAVERVEGTVETSPDVVVVGTGAESQDSTVTPSAVRADVRLVLGDSVTVDALGLTGRLDGQLTVLARPGRPPLGNGELRIVNGRYRIYRQTFDIDQGQVLYANTPLSDPALDLRITREAQQVTAGMEVTGRATDPRVQLFSTPSMSDEEVLAYLIMGRPLRSLSQTEGSRVTSVAKSAGLAGGNLLLARLGSMFGLEQARIEQTTTTPAEGEEDAAPTTETSLVLGSQILPRVHVGYAIGFYGAANVLQIRYIISDHWILRTESGVETGADLLYRIGR